MSYTIQEINGCTKKIVFNYETVNLTSQIDQALKVKQRSVNLKGFRKGKAPLDMVRKMYGPQIENEALYQFVSQEYFQAIQKEGIKAIGYPQFENTKYESDSQKVAFEATVETFPEFEIKDFSNLKFTQDSFAVATEELEALRKQYLESKAEMKELTDDSAQLEDGYFAVMNFQGEMADGSKPENMKGEEFLLEIGSNQFIPGFEEQMIGMKKNEHKTISVTFPADYHQKDLQNAEVKFHIDLLEIKKKELPVLTDELAKEFGFDNAEDFNKKTQKNLELKKKNESEQKLHQEILEKLISENQFDVPQALIEQQKDALKKDLSQNLKQQGFNDAMLKTYFDRWVEDLDQKANFQVRSGLILDKLATQYGIETSDADFDLKMEQMAEQANMKLDDVKNYYSQNDNLKKNLMYALREEKTFVKIKENLKIN